MCKTYMTTNCPLCGCSGASLRWIVKRWQPNLRVVRCNECELHRLDPIPSQSQLALFYGEGYFTGEQEYAHIDERSQWDALMRRNSRIVAAIERFCPTKGAILEIGCSFGSFLAAARQRGWKTKGVEVSSFSGGYARDSAGLDVFIGLLEDAHLPSKSFDAIYMSEVIEHIPNPLEMLKELRRLLKDGGLLVLCTGTTNGIVPRVMRGKWEYFLPGHVVYWSEQTITRAAEVSGFVVEKIRYGNVDVGLLSALEHVFNVNGMSMVAAKGMLKVLVGYIPARLGIPMKEMTLYARAKSA